MFIVFEGPEGAGKTTQIALLADRLRADGFTVVTTRQPGGEELGKRLRSILLDKQSFEIDRHAELFLMMADRAQSVSKIIRPALESDAIVICDRYRDSSIAYQGAGRKISIDEVETLNNIAIQGIEPDMTILLDIDPAIGLARQSEKTRMESENMDFHNRVRQTYKETVMLLRAGKIQMINADRSIDEVATDVWNTIKRVLNT